MLYPTELAVARWKLDHPGPRNSAHCSEILACVPNVPAALVVGSMLQQMFQHLGFCSCSSSTFRIDFGALLLLVAPGPPAAGRLLRVSFCVLSRNDQHEHFRDHLRNLNQKRQLRCSIRPLLVGATAVAAQEELFESLAWG